MGAGGFCTFLNTSEMCPRITNPPEAPQRSHPPFSSISLHLDLPTLRSNPCNRRMASRTPCGPNLNISVVEKRRSQLHSNQMRQTQSVFCCTADIENQWLEYESKVKMLLMLLWHYGLFYNLWHHSWQYFQQGWRCVRQSSPIRLWYFFVCHCCFMRMESWIKIGIAGRPKEMDDWAALIEKDAPHHPECLSHLAESQTLCRPLIQLRLYFQSQMNLRGAPPALRGGMHYLTRLLLS